MLTSDSHVLRLDRSGENTGSCYRIFFHGIVHQTDYLHVKVANFRSRRKSRTTIGTWLVSSPSRRIRRKGTVCFSLSSVRPNSSPASQTYIDGTCQFTNSLEEQANSELPNVPYLTSVFEVTWHIGWRSSSDSSGKPFTLTFSSG